MPLGFLLSRKNTDTLRQGKINGAMGMFLRNRAFRGMGTIQGDGFPQQDASSNLLNPALPGTASTPDFYAVFDTLGPQGAFQQLMKSNGYSLENALARPSAQQAYSILRSSGLDAGSAQQLLKSNGYHLDDATQLPGLLKDDTGEQLHREEDLLGNFAEFLKELEKISEQKGNPLEIDLPKEVIEFDKQYGATSETDLLPNAEKAILTEEKFTGYFLDPNHKVGGNKALVFEKVLGYNKGNWSELRSQIQQGLLKYRCIERLESPYGQKFEVRMIIKGPTGQYAKVKTGWIIDEGQVNPRIVSAYIL